jgi:DNA topoisomerase-1
MKDQVEEELRENLATLRPEEAAVLALLESRLTRTLDAQASTATSSR